MMMFSAKFQPNPEVRTHIINNWIIINKMDIFFELVLAIIQQILYPVLILRT